MTLRKGWDQVRAALAQPQDAGHCWRHRAADRGQLAALRLCDQLAATSSPEASAIISIRWPTSCSAASSSSERLSRLQWAAVAIAAAGVAVLAAGALGTLWISLTLCFSFATYGLLRKHRRGRFAAGPDHRDASCSPRSRSAGSLFRPAPGRADLRHAPAADAWLLVAAGIISTTPLLLFTAAARRLPYSTVGMLQFIAPTVQFLLAVLAYGEPFTRAHAIAFAAIWSAVALYMSV